MSSIVHSTGESAPPAPLPKASPRSDEPASPVDIPVDNYLQETGRPYIAKQLDGLMAWDSLDTGTQENGELIDEVFHKGVKSGRYRNDDVGYQDFLRHYEKVTDTKNAPLAMKVNVIAEFLRYQQRRKDYA